MQCVGIPPATCLFNYHYILLFSRIKHTRLAGYLHSTQRVEDTEQCEAWPSHWEHLWRWVRCCFLFGPGVQIEDSHLTWTDSFYSNPIWKQSYQGRMTLEECEEGNELFFDLDEAGWRSMGPQAKQFLHFFFKVLRLFVDCFTIPLEVLRGIRDQA